MSNRIVVLEMILSDRRQVSVVSGITVCVITSTGQPFVVGDIQPA